MKFVEISLIEILWVGLNDGDVSIVDEAAGTMVALVAAEVDIRRISLYLVNHNKNY